ncbi:MAG: thiamine phosphate synthase [bacterium]|nr:thiamine phosphate synthase [bacterium]
MDQLTIRNHPLMFITDRHRTNGRDNADIVRAALRGGLKWVQFREPDLNDLDFYNQCLKIKEICGEFDAGLIVNDRLDVAALVEAEGVHLGHGDLPVKIVREYMGEDFIIGYSAHSIEEAVTAIWEGSNYLTYSPMFHLSHKESPYKPYGIDGAKDILTKVKAPIFFLGGIKLSDLEDLARSINPLRVAAVSMISEAENIKASVEKTLRIINPTQLS